MVDDATALAFIFQNHFKKRPPTIELKTNFLYPTKPGKVIGYGRVVKSGKILYSWRVDWSKTIGLLLPQHQLV